MAYSQADRINMVLRVSQAIKNDAFNPYAELDDKAPSIVRNTRRCPANKHYNRPLEMTI